MATARPVRAGDRRLTPALALLGLAALAWVVSAERMRGMEMTTDLGAVGWFAVTWVLMMAAMMLPALLPALRDGGGAAAFVSGYLAVWTAAGLAAYALVDGLGSPAGGPVAVVVVLAAAAYQLTGAKGACLDRCRRATVGGLRAGLRHGAACVGCSAGLMAALFALGVMSVTWMAVVAALIAAERLAPWRTAAAYGVAAVLIVLAVLA
jgi:predicted metal-binding membrane protein